MKPELCHVIKLFSQGFSAGYSSSHLRKPGKRGKVVGWSKVSVRSNERFLLGVNATDLFDKYDGYSLTLTVRDCPATGQEWGDILQQFFLALRGNEFNCRGCHWLVEWQKRKVPHIHLSVFFDKGTDFDVEKLFARWLALTFDFGSVRCGQYSAKITGFKGWCEYLVKHSSRGLYHYQRAFKSIPVGWKNQSTGRMWGHWGNMCCEEMDYYRVPGEVFFKLRRLMRSYALSKSRCYNKNYRARSIRSARRCLRHSDYYISCVRGMTSWLCPVAVKRYILSLNPVCLLE